MSARDTPLSPGRMVGRYRIESLLGRGGMGAVYRALDTRLERAVALKVLTSSGDMSEARFLREAKSVAALSHPNAVVVHDVGEDGALLYIAMELVDGATMATLVGIDVPLATRLRWLVDVARALAAAHEKGIVHRDVKPENVMIAKDGTVRVLDFGIARPSGLGALDATLTSDGIVVGTPIYMSPEQLRAEPVDGRSDQFSWGVTAHELLAGRVPWTNVHNAAVLVSDILTRPAPRLENVPAEVADIVARALEKDAGRRHSTMSAIADALEPLAERGTRPTPGDRPANRSDDAFAKTQVQVDTGARAVRRRRGLVLLGGLTVTAAALVAVGLVWRRPTVVTDAPASAPSVSPPVSPCSPAAQKLYEQGVTEWETRSLHQANATWRRALVEDAACAPAALRLVLGVEVNAIPISEVRAFHAHASEHRERLTPVELDLLEASAPFVGVTPDEKAAHDRYHRIAARWPDDPLVLYLHAFALQMERRPREAIPVLERVIAIRPRFAPAYAGLVAAAVDEATRSRWEDACVERMPRHAWCRSLVGNRLSWGTDCAALEQYARRSVAENPGASSDSYLARALIATGAPREAVEEVARRSDDELFSMRNGARSFSNLGAAAALAGDYALAESELRADHRATLPDGSDRQTWAATLARLLLDVGRDAEAHALIRRTKRAAGALSPAGARQPVEFVVLMTALGEMSLAEAQASLDSPADDESPEARWLDWSEQTGAFAASPAAARAALATMPAWKGRGGKEHYQIARLQALAGDHAAARGNADVATRSCDHVEWPFDVPRAFLVLGESAEALGDFAAARAAYQTVVDRWGALKPKPVLAARARARLNAIAGK